MLKKPPIILILLIFILFVGIGDSVLPEPMKSASLNTRESINKNLLGLFPTWKSKLKPNERTNKAIEEAEKKGK
ncbi:hypothetical protein [Rivularia sp. UHCC 0363]|uniref:hypothetical protein n=1 Tax=Rivularia sp. UHCC 0363 TaxID=3110244 RepID=UPI002B1EF9FF|nr:hypothetical protein [Rivularia sp. UHCC 0363]MEA5597975.1 hypothetical protein [Rivularia sp. UHCC 0363]